MDSSLQPLAATFRRLDAGEYDAMLSRVAAQFSPRVVSDAKARTPVVTGKLQKSIRVALPKKPRKGRGTLLTVVAYATYGTFVERRKRMLDQAVELNLTAIADAISDELVREVTRG